MTGKGGLWWGVFYSRPLLPVLRPFPRASTRRVVDPVSGNCSDIKTRSSRRTSEKGDGCPGSSSWEPHLPRNHATNETCIQSRPFSPILLLFGSRISCPLGERRGDETEKIAVIEKKRKCRGTFGRHVDRFSVPFLNAPSGPVVPSLAPHFRCLRWDLAAGPKESCVRRFVHVHRRKGRSDLIPTDTTSTL